MVWIARLLIACQIQKRTKTRIKSVALFVALLGVFWIGISRSAQAKQTPAPLPPRKPDVRLLYPDRFLPPPTLVSRSDAKLAKKAFKALDRNRFKDAKRLTRKIKDADLKRLLLWQSLTARRSPSRFSDIRRFLDQTKDQGQDWPKRRTLMKRAEETMPSLPPQDVLAWFQVMGGPVSNQGRVREAEAHLKLEPSAKTSQVIRALWIKGNFTKAQEKNFYRRHKRLITVADNKARLERLVWAERFWPARRQIWKVDDPTRKLAVARLWLMRREGNVDKAIRILQKSAPHLIDHAGLIYERARWRRRKNRSDDAAQLIIDFKGDLIRPDKWWTERAFLARTYLQKNQPKKAYILTSRHGLSPTMAAKYSDAEWLSGWIQLRFLNKPKSALKHFSNMLKVVNYPISKSRGAYWSGRATLVLGHIKQARAWFAKAAQYPTTYYGQLASARLGNGISLPRLSEVLRPNQALITAFKNNHLHRAAQILAEIGERQRMRPFIIHLADAHATGPWKKMTADFATRYGRPDLAIRVAKLSERAGTPLGNVSYPALKPPHHKVLTNPVETPLVLAVIRQESAFYFSAKSHAGARGLMQVMPATAKRVARDNRLPYDRDRLSRDANYNLIIGQVYLSDMVGKFNGSYPMALAAYNAGPHRVNRWVKTFGDPRTKAIDIIDWIEMIPYTETRNYVQRVLENLGVYRIKLSTQQAIRPLT
ncbi:MAG: lytic transglycosylase domain-containing protein [Magnetovibrio sp.]|nr:lytic transglycosylase domain-containing protein [Magnetovibrio sp.]